MEPFCMRNANKMGGMVESQMIGKLNLSAPLDEPVDLFSALNKLMAISLTHQITNKVMLNVRKNSILHLQFGKPAGAPNTILQSIIADRLATPYGKSSYSPTTNNDNYILT